MFGLLGAFILGLFHVGENVYGSRQSKVLKEDAIYRNQNKISYNGTYNDYYNRERDIATNQLVTRKLINGDEWIYSTKGYPIRNVTEARRDDEYIKRVAEVPVGTKAVLYTSWTKTNSPIKEDDGNRYPTRVVGLIFKDIKTGDLYFERRITWGIKDLDPGPSRLSTTEMSKYGVCFFYIDTKNGRIVSVADRSLKNYIQGENKDRIDEFIEHFNEEQDAGGWKLRYQKRRDEELGYSSVVISPKKMFYCEF